MSAAACASPITERHDWLPVPHVSLTPPPTPPPIVVGFVGGVLKHDNPLRGEVKLAEHFRTEYPSGVYVETFENRRREKALRVILTPMGAERSGLLSENEKHRAPFSMATAGAARPWSSLLANSTNAASPFCLRSKRTGSDVLASMTAGFLPTLPTPPISISRTAFKPSILQKTQVLGDFRFDYKEHPIHCPEYPWYDRVFAKTHTEIDCDPAVWSQVEALIGQEISQAATK
ncbi:MAG TPA: hypothetical protein VNB49_03765 [Candidatus Dormibacteraeota bacterium]|nr:hypothetical protein [Candidatus Dormibacteraeota bacterium]